jgi:hypothetical protein
MIAAVFDDYTKASIPVIRMTITMTIPRYRLDLSVLSYCKAYAIKIKIAPAQSM